MNATERIVKKRTGRFWITVVVGALVVLVGVCYFVVTSSAFFKGVILPRIGAALNADVSVSGAEISPFSHVVLQDIKVTAKGAEPLFSAARVTARYDLLAIIRGNIRVSEVSVVSPTVTLIENASGASNLEPLLKTEKPAASPATTPRAASAPAKPAAAPALDIKAITLKDATIRYVKNLRNGERESLELSQVNLAIQNIKNGGTGKLDLAAVIACEQPSNATLQATVNGAFTFALSADLKPGVVAGAATVSIDKATGPFADLAALAAKLDCDVTPTEVKQISLAFTKAGTGLGELRVSGPFDPEKLEGKLNVDVASLDRQVLNLAGAAAGLDFGSTTVNATNEIELTRGGAVITAAGMLNVARLQITRQGETSPTLDVHCDYAVTVNRAEQSVLVNTLNLTGTQAQHLLAQAKLTSPMRIAWGATSNAVGEAALNLTLTGLNLADWSEFAAGYAPSGVANATMNLTSQNGGEQLAFDLDGRVDGFSARVGTNQISAVNVRLRANGRSTNLRQFTLSDYRLDVTQQTQSVLTVSGAATFDKLTRNADVQVATQAALEPLAKLIAPWVAAVDTYAPGGAASVKLNLQAQQGAKQLAFDVDARVNGLTARAGQNPIAPVDVHLATKGNGTDLEQFALSNCKLDVLRQDESVLAASVTGGFDAAFTNADLSVTTRASLDKLLALYPVSGATCSTGSFAVAGHITAQTHSLAVTGQVTLADLTGGYGDYRFDSFGAAIDLDAALRGRQLEIRKATGQLREGSTAGGRFDISGTCDLDKKTGDLAAKLAGFTQDDLRPFLQPSLGDKKLVSVSLNATTAAGFNAAGDGTLKADMTVTNLVIQDLANSFPATPLAARLIVDAGASNKVATIHQGQLALTATARATNELNLTGTVDYSRSNAVAGAIKLAADSLDATAYYDLFAGTNKAVKAKAETKPAGAVVGAAAESRHAEAVEPAAVNLPLGRFTCELAVGRFYLRQLEITNLQAIATLNGSRVAVNPCRLTLNGAPINATVNLDLSAPGYRYDMALRADKIPLAPLVNSFSPTYNKLAQGDLSANLQIKGAGVTGPNLRKNLAGSVTLNLTNANIAIVGPKVKAVLTPIMTVLGAPQLLQSPLDYIMADLQIGGGNIETRQFEAHSAAFRALSQGTIPIADVLTDSPLSQPMDVELSQDVASQLRFANLPTDGSYVRLPTFVHLAGTLGDPTAKTDKAVIAGLTAQGIAGAIGGRAGGILGGIGGLLTGQSASTNAPSQQAPSQQRTPFNPFNLLR
ncbi:MAG TPA: AsmA family protein [Verrucomicrobiae bacterium]|nr:AsmA family protein [Verrucomicrobiae bacterium]